MTLILVCPLIVGLAGVGFTFACLWHKQQQKQRQYGQTKKNLPEIEDADPDTEIKKRDTHNKRQLPLPKFQLHEDNKKVSEYILSDI